MYIPEAEPLSVNFQQAGYESELFIPNLGLLFYIMLGQFCLYGIDLIMLFSCKSCPKLTKLAVKLNGYLYVNGTIRLFMEAYLDLTLVTFLNIDYFDWNNKIPANIASNMLAAFFAVAVVVFPITLLIYFACNMKKWNDPDFSNKSGTLLEGVNLERKET